MKKLFLLLFSVVFITTVFISSLYADVSRCYQGACGTGQPVTGLSCTACFAGVGNCWISPRGFEYRKPDCNSQSGSTRYYNTEMLQLDITGGGLGTIMIRESPTLASTGGTNITDLGGGMFQINSFFDIFTEISVDGGNTWTQDSNEPMHQE